MLLLATLSGSGLGATAKALSGTGVESSAALAVTDQRAVLPPLRWFVPASVLSMMARLCSES